MRSKPDRKPALAVPANTPKLAQRARETPPKKIQRDAAGKFVKGVSGNPSGRSMIAHEVREYAGAHTVEALETILEIMRDRKRDPSVRLVAAKAVLDRAVGKPMQPIAGTLGGNLVNITMQSGAVITSEDAAAVYRELCGDPSLDISQLKLAAPTPAQAAAQPIESDVLAPSNATADKLAVWQRLGE
jgi:hypothetical protein